jgi:hypothetical protein
LTLADISFCAENNDKNNICTIIFS